MPLAAVVPCEEPAALDMAARASGKCGSPRRRAAAASAQSEPWTKLCRRLQGGDQDTCTSMGRLLSDTRVNVRLLDLNLIIIGTGPIAQELLRRRRAAGGRACLLWTDEWPDGGGGANDASSRLPAFDLQSVAFKLPTFRWMPPEMRPPSEPALDKIRHAHGCWTSEFSSYGPDVVELHLACREGPRNPETPNLTFEHRPCAQMLLTFERKGGPQPQSIELKPHNYPPPSGFWRLAMGVEGTLGMQPST